MRDAGRTVIVTVIDNPRLRLLLATQGRRVAIALAVLAGLLLLVAVSTALSPPTETVTEPGDRQEVATALEHSSVVRTTDAPWSQGTTLENHPAYLLNASPVLDLQLATDAPAGTTVVHELRLRYRVEREGAVVWEDSRRLGRSEATVGDGPATTDASVDVERVASRTDRLQQQFAGLGSVETTVVGTVEYDTGDYGDSASVTAPVTVAGSFYWIDAGDGVSQTHGGSQTVEREAPVDWSRVLVLLVLSGLSGGGAVAASRYREDEDLDALRLRVHRERFDEWISRGSIPLEVGRDAVALDSLPDLVDVAIDTGQRVVHDERRGVYAVIEGDVVYYFAVGGDWAAAGGSGPDGPSNSGPDGRRDPAAFGDAGSIDDGSTVDDGSRSDDPDRVRTDGASESEPGDDPLGE